MRLKIGICEDDKTQQRNLRRMVREWGESRGYQLETRLYDHSAAFWFDWCEQMDLDVLLLDIDLGSGQINGMELAKKIREKDSRIVIIFITALTEYMNQGYDVQAFHFLIKLVSETCLQKILDKACAAAAPGRQKEYLLLTEETEVSRIPFHEILYAEAFSHSVTIHMASESRDFHSVGMKNLEERLPERDFFRCHRSYLVNLSHVSRIGRCEAFLDDGSRLPVSRRKEKELFRAFVDYYNDR